MTGTRTPRSRPRPNNRAPRCLLRRNSSAARTSCSRRSGGHLGGLEIRGPQCRLPSHVALHVSCGDQQVGRDRSMLGRNIQDLPATCELRRNKRSRAEDPVARAGMVVPVSEGAASWVNPSVGNDGLHTQFFAKLGKGCVGTGHCSLSHTNLGSGHACIANQHYISTFLAAVLASPVLGVPLGSISKIWASSCATGRC